jgi:hypothetical protein
MSDGVRKTFHPNGDGTFSLNYSQDAEPILENNRQWQGERQTTDGLRRIASIPVVVWMAWLNETNGALDRMPKHELAAFIRRKLNDPDYRWLRTT